MNYSGILRVSPTYSSRSRMVSHTTTALMCINFCTYIYYICDVKITCTWYVCHVLQVLGWLWIMCSIPTTVLWMSQILELVVLLWTAQLYPAIFLDNHQELIGTFPMEVVSQILILYHTTELGLILHYLLLEQFFSTVTLGQPQQESSTVTYLMLQEVFRASMWEYILPPQVSPVHWRETKSSKFV